MAEARVIEQSEAAKWLRWLEINYPEEAEELARVFGLGSNFGKWTKSKLNEVNLPDPERGVPTLYEDCCKHITGYSTKPINSRVVALDRQKYSYEEAKLRFTRLRTKNNWRVWGRMFWTARYWCWRVYEPSTIK